MRKSDLLYVSWSLTAEDEGVVIVQYADDAGVEKTERYGLSGPDPFDALPEPVAELLRQDGRRHGAWYG